MNAIQSQVKIVGSNGQISLGKEFSGKLVLIDQINEGIWIIKSGTFIPDSEQWLHQGDNMAKLDRALEWAEKTPAKDNFEEISRKIENGKN